MLNIYVDKYVCSAALDIRIEFEHGSAKLKQVYPVVSNEPVQVPLYSLMNQMLADVVIGLDRLCDEKMALKQLNYANTQLLEALKNDKNKLKKLNAENKKVLDGIKEQNENSALYLKFTKEQNEKYAEYLAIYRAPYVKNSYLNRLFNFFEACFKKCGGK